MNIENPTACLAQLVKILNIPITRKSISEELDKHPNTSTFLAFSDVLTNWGVPNGAFKIECEDLTSIPLPFIAHFTAERKGEFVLITRITKDHVWVSNERWDNHMLTLEEFSKLYTGNVLLAESSDSAGEQNYPLKKRKELLERKRFPFVIAGFIILTLAFLYQSSYFDYVGLQLALLTLAKSAGLLVSVLLLIQSIDAKNPWVQRFCRVGRRNNCNSILSSKAAKITDELSWSEVGFFYFGGTWLFLIYNFKSSAAMQTLALLNLVCLPYTLYSFYYQSHIARKWCLLCCMVLGLLWVEFASLVSFIDQPSKVINENSLLGLIAFIMAPVLLWVFIKPYLMKARNLEAVKQQLKVFKYNADIFQRTLLEQVPFPLPDEDHSIVLGPREANQVITVVTNPYCSPCSKAHQTLDDWLTQRNDLQVRIVFSTSDDPEENKNKIARHLMTLKRQNQNMIRQALHGWYGQAHKNYRAWASQYPVKEEAESSISLQKQREWCGMINLKSTPTILINGYKLPDLYQLEDIKYFI